MEDIFVPLSFFLAIFAILYVYWTTRMKVRLAMIEKGADAALFKNPPSKYSFLKWGIFAIAVAVGIISGYGLSKIISSEVTAYFTMIFFFGGIGLIIAHLMILKLTKKDEE